MLVLKNQCTKSRIIPLCWFALLPPFGIVSHLNHLCRHLITKILRNGPRAHFPFNLPLFGDLCQHQQKATKGSATTMQMRTQICFDSNLAYLDHSLPPLGLFLQIKFIFLSLSQTRLFGHKENIPRKIDQVPKTPLFPIIKILPHKRPNFAIRVFWSNQKF